MKYNIFQGEKVRLRAETASDIEEKKRKILESEYDTESARLCDTMYLPYSVESRIDGWESDVKRFNTWEFCRLIIGSYTLYIGKPKPSVDISEYTLVNDSIEFKKQRNYYTFTPKRNGTYYFGFTNIPEGYKYEVNVYNPGGENLTFGNLYRTYATLSLTNGQPYTIVVSDYGYHGDYSLIVGKQKETLDISNYDVVKDSFQFPCQWNVYLFTPDTDGRYSFTVNNDYGFVRAYNPGGSLLSPFGAIDLALTAGQTYTIKVEHNEYKGYFGNYNLNISRE